MTHTQKMSDYMAALSTCMACGATVNIDDVLRIGGRYVDDIAKTGLRCTGSTLVRALGPIGVAYTIGEVGAFAIETGGEWYASNLGRQFACDNLPRVADMKAHSCDDAARARNAFESQYCPIYFQVGQGDVCGPGGLQSFEPVRPACDNIDLTCEESAANETLGCVSAIRLREMYRRRCNGVVPPCG